MGKDESFYIIRKEDDAFDQAWNAVAMDLPKPDEGLWDSRERAATYDDGWAKVLVNPDPKNAQGYRSGQLFAFEITVNEKLAPMRFTTRLRGEVVTRVPGSKREEEERHQLALDSPAIEMTYLGPGGYTLDDPVSNPFRQTYLIPKRGLCSCGQTHWLPSSYETKDGPVKVRYWFEITGQRLHTSESRLRWTGKTRLSELDGREPPRVLAIPLQLVGDWYSPRCFSRDVDALVLGRTDQDPPTSVSNRDGEVHVMRYLLEHERPTFPLADSKNRESEKSLVSPEPTVSSLRLVHRIVTIEREGALAALNYRFEVSLGVHQHGPQYRALYDCLLRAHPVATLRLIRSSTIVPPEPKDGTDAKGKGKGKAKASTLAHGITLPPIVQVEQFGKTHTTDKHYVSTELRLVGPPGEKERAQEVFVKFDGYLALSMEEYGAEIDKLSAKQGARLILPTRVQACNAEVRYDLIAELTHPVIDAPTGTCSLRAKDVRIDLPASLAQRLQHRPTPDPSRSTFARKSERESESFAFEMLSIARREGFITEEEYVRLALLPTEDLGDAIGDLVFSQRQQQGQHQRQARDDVAASSHTGEPTVATVGAQLPPYEPPSDRVGALSLDEKRPEGPAYATANGDDFAPPPSYPADDLSTATTGNEHASTSGGGGRFSRIFSSFGRRPSSSTAPFVAGPSRFEISSPISHLPPAASGSLPPPPPAAPPLSPFARPRPPIALPAPPPAPSRTPGSVSEAEEPAASEEPPSWEETVRDDMIEDWVAASVAIGTDADEEAPVPVGRERSEIP
ncbi:hypothetical protein JCM10908_000632 [Rhodotorula pacifica]|uniref:uncharacterized protein n=1 Tax=Rhodotorula pacifica TaxID=1495444 RepID=UPI0031823110